MADILVVDDQTLEEQIFNSLILNEEFHVHTAFGVTNGYSIAKRYLPDLIICNLQSDAEGFQFIEKVVSSEYTQNIPVIYLSSVDDFANQRKCMNIGADDYFVKPFSDEELLKAVKCRLSKRKRLKEKMMRICKESLEAEEKSPLKDDHILVTIGNRLQLFKFKNIVCITALKEYSKFRTFDGQSIVVRKSLKCWENILPDKGFLRIHRATIINVEAIEKIEKLKQRTYVVHLNSVKEPLEFSQRYANIMRKTFST